MFQSVGAIGLLQSWGKSRCECPGSGWGFGVGVLVVGGGGVPWSEEGDGGGLVVDEEPFCLFGRRLGFVDLWKYFLAIVSAA